MSDTPEFTGKVKVFGGVGEEGQTFQRAKVTVLGEDFKLMVPGGDDGVGRRLRQFDRLTGGKMTDHDDGTITFTGTSEALVDEVGLRPESSDEVRWEMELRGCQSCR